MKKIKIIAWLGPSGSRIYRAEQIFKYLNRTGKYECLISPMALTDEQLLWADIIFMQHTVDPKAIATAWAYKMERGKKIITDFDDTMEENKNNPFYKHHVRAFGADWFKQLATISDLVTVTTETLKEEFTPYSKNIHVLPNYLDMEAWDLPIIPNETGKIRLLYSGSMTHQEDVKMIMPVIRQVLEERKNVRFVYCGDNYAPLLKGIDPMKYEQIPSMPDFYKYPLLAHTFMADIAVAPLVDNHFNRAKSFLKYLEYGICRIPGVFSPVAYSGVIKSGENGILAITKEEWKEAIDLLIDNRLTRNYIGKRAYQDVSRNYAIAKHVDKWDELYQNVLLSTAPDLSI